MAEPTPEELAVLTVRLQLLGDRLDDDPEKARRLIESAEPMEALAARAAEDAARAAAIVSDRSPTVEAAAAPAPGVARQASTPHQSDDDADEEEALSARLLRSSVSKNLRSPSARSPTDAGAGDPKRRASAPTREEAAEPRTLGQADWNPSDDDDSGAGGAASPAEADDSDAMDGSGTGSDDEYFNCPQVLNAGGLRYTCNARNKVSVVRAQGSRARCADCGKRLALPERFQEPPSGGLAWSNIPPGL